MKSTFNFTTDPGSAPTPSALPLHALRPGDAGRVVDVDTSAPAGVRLLDLGFVPGTLVRVVRRAPLRDPVVYELRGYRVCLRRADAMRVWVEPVAESALEASRASASVGAGVAGPAVAGPAAALAEARAEARTGDPARVRGR